MFNFISYPKSTYFNSFSSLSFSLLYLSHILYPLNRLTTLELLTIPLDYSRSYQSVVNYLSISLLLRLLLVLLYCFRLVDGR